MIPLTFAETGAENMVKKVGGNPETRRFLKELGFVAGSTVTVINTMSGNVIVSIKDSRIAISEEMAAKIMI